MNILRLPDHAHLILEDGLKQIDCGSGHADIATRFELGPDSLKIHLTGGRTPLRGLHLRWDETPPDGALILSDMWGRQDGEQGWKTLDPRKPMPWQFMLRSSGRTAGIGVCVNPDSMACWHLDREGLCLYLDTRNGGSGVELSGAEILAAEIKFRKGVDGESPFEASRAFCIELAQGCKLRARDEVFFGGNNWYYAYSAITHESCVEDARRIGKWASGAPVKPFMVIDDGWQVAHRDAVYNSGPWHATNRKFEHMAKTAEEMARHGVRPGIWYRPMVTLEGALEKLRIQNNASPPFSEAGFALDPTLPETQQRIHEDAGRFTEWGYELIKHDFSTVDLLGTWLHSGEALVKSGTPWNFSDKSMTNAQVVKNVYRMIMEGAGDTRIIGCQTIGHLGVGTIDIQRVGGDVSGRDWERTRRMGPNSLAFRMSQHGVFFQIDADCATITPTVPTRLELQWLELLAKSGTPLFVSADPRGLDSETEPAVREALQTAAKRPPEAEPLDWMETPAPRVWKFGDETREFSWLPKIGAPPPSLVPGDTQTLIEKA